MSGMFCTMTEVPDYDILGHKAVRSKDIVRPLPDLLSTKETAPHTDASYPREMAGEKMCRNILHTFRHYSFNAAGSPKLLYTLNGDDINTFQLSSLFLHNFIFPINTPT